MLLELDHISKIYGDLRAVDDLNLTVPEGEWLAIVGSSGSGKTTLMNMIGCMDTPSKGSVKLEGRKLEDLNATQLADVRKNLIGLVFQKFYLVPHLTAVENVMVAQYYHSVVDEKQAMEALEKVGLKDRAHHLPGQLSGGEQQRVCVARALINDPKLILADEPTGNLDEKNEKIVLDLFRKLHEQGTTIIVVTHDALVASCAQREIMLNHGVLVGEKWNDEDARKAYEAAGGKPASTGAQVEGAQNGETEKSQEEQSQSQSNGSDSSDGSDSSSSHNDPSTTTSDKKDTGNYKDGNYSINGQYGPVGEDSIDVHLTIKDGNVETVNIIGHPFTTISKNHQDDFAKAINGVVDGKPLKGLKVDKVAGASWTSDAFNKALEVARQEASIQE